MVERLVDLRVEHRFNHWDSNWCRPKVAQVWHQVQKLETLVYATDDGGHDYIVSARTGCELVLRVDDLELGTALAYNLSPKEALQSSQVVCGSCKAWRQHKEREAEEAARRSKRVESGREEYHGKL